MLLNDSRIRSTRPADKPKKLFDGGMLFLFLSPKGGKFWRVKYKFQGKEKLLSLGAYPYISLKDARTKRDEAKVPAGARDRSGREEKGGALRDRTHV
jgi:hypothetical protein